MKILSYNINGLNAFTKPGPNANNNSEGFFKDSVAQNDSKLCHLKWDYDNYDIYCFQEVKMSEDEKVRMLLYQWANYDYWLASNDVKKGYAGVLTWMDNKYFRGDKYQDRIKLFTTEEKVFSLNNDKTYTEGRIIVSEFENFYLLNVYVPNSGKKDELRKDWDKQFINYVKSLNKPVIICGDMNVCHTELDYWGNYKKVIDTAPGLMQYEIDDFNTLLTECNLIDAYRYTHGDERKYSWYSTRNKNAVEKNQGWRIDYFLVSNELKDKIISCDICQGYQSPDHSPIILDIAV